MPRVVLELPALLSDVVGVRELAVDARTPLEALAAAAAARPALATHLFDEKGAPRRHLLCFVNEKMARGAALASPLKDGDRVRVHQAVSGG